MKKFMKQLAVYALALVCVSMFTLGAFAAEPKEANAENEVTVQLLNSRGATITTVQVPLAATNGNVTLSIPSSTRAKKIVFLGNQPGGGANTTVMLIASRIGLNGKSVALNGQAQTIYSSSIGVTGNIDINYTVFPGGTYNLAFMAFE